MSHSAMPSWVQTSCLKQCCGCCFGPKHNDDDSSGDEIEDKSASGLSHVGKAAYDTLRRHHNHLHHILWNVSSGKVIGDVHQTPKTNWSSRSDPPKGADDWFPAKIGEIVGRTEFFCDVMSLGPPDGLFLVEMKKGLARIAERAGTDGNDNEKKPVIVRMMFGNIVGMPVNCAAVMKALTEDLPEDSNMRIWVGAWRHGVSWNHAKIVAVDGQYLHTGGHNMWDEHYLKSNPVHDLSLEIEGRVAKDGHDYANKQWLFVEVNQRTICGWIVDKIPDGMPLVMHTRVTISEWPEGKATTYAPYWERSMMPVREPVEGRIPIISMGPYGSAFDKLTPLAVKRPSDDAFVSMILSAKKIVRLALQDLGPVCIPGTKRALPGCTWPKNYLRALGRVIYEKGVDVEIALSNPGSIPGDLSPVEACYGNGWSCVDVAAEIIKTIKDQFDVDDALLRKEVEENLRVCFIREERGETWENGQTMGMHAKHFIADDVCAYIGSQNLYVCDLAEWGVVIDDKATVKKIMEDYWNPMWNASFQGGIDCDVQSVMDGLDVDRSAPETGTLDKLNAFNRRQMMLTAARQQAVTPGKAAEYMYAKQDEEGQTKKKEHIVEGAIDDVIASDELTADQAESMIASGYVSESQRKLLLLNFNLETVNLQEETKEGGGGEGTVESEGVEMTSAL